MTLDPSDTQRLDKLRIVWFAFLVSVLMLVVVAVVTPPGGEDPGPIGLVLPVLGVLLALAQPLIGRALAAQVDYYQGLVIRWALAEAIAVLGFVVTFLGGSYAVLGVMAFLALATMATLMPSESGRARWRELRGDR